jgi:hypothetical protein
MGFAVRDMIWDSIAGVHLVLALLSHAPHATVHEIVAHTHKPLQFQATSSSAQGCPPHLCTQVQAVRLPSMSPMMMTVGLALLLAAGAHAQVCRCPGIFAPVCAGGRPFSNECEAKCAGYQACAITLASPEGKCPQFLCEEPGKEDGVCDHTGTFHASSCDALSKGICSCATTPAAGGHCMMCGCLPPSMLGPDDAVCANGENYASRCEAGFCGDGICDQYIEEGRCMCPRDYTPVCAGGEKFSNECEAKCEGYGERDITKLSDPRGECPCVCPGIFAPVCAGGKKFSNECEAKCEDYGERDITKLSDPRGECPCVCPRTLVYAPVCAKGVTYTSKCDALCVDGIREEDITCKNYNPKPVCANDVPYENKCLAKCDGTVKNRDITKGECPGECKTKCEKPVDGDAVCAKGVEYKSECEAKCHNFKNREIAKCACINTKKNGKCKPEAKWVE